MVGVCVHQMEQLIDDLTAIADATDNPEDARRALFVTRSRLVPAVAAGADNTIDAMAGGQGGDGRPGAVGNRG